MCVEAKGQFIAILLSNICQFRTFRLPNVILRTLFAYLLNIKKKFKLLGHRDNLELKIGKQINVILSYIRFTSILGVLKGKSTWTIRNMVNN